MTRLVRRTRGRLAPECAAGPWTRVDAKQPEPGRSFLIAATYGGIEAFDVAFYNGRRPDGSHWWTLTDIDIDARCIDFYAAINAVPKD